MSHKHFNQPHSLDFKNSEEFTDNNLKNSEEHNSDKSNVDYLEKVKIRSCHQKVR